MKYGLIGEKLSHSFSKEIHGQLFDYEYELKELPSTELETFFSERDFCAVNVTIPYKEMVIPYLDVVDERAQRIGAVNTIINRAGKLYGYNTDFDGLCALVAHSGITLRGKKILILGSGGTSKTAMEVAQQSGCATVLRVSRTARDGCITYEQAREQHADAQVIINTTPCGMFRNADEGKSPIDLDEYPHLEGVIDVVFNPLRTKLVCDAHKRGIPAIGGLYMLVAQAAFAADKFVGKAVSSERVENIYHSMMSDKENIVLVGMPGCGKTTVGKRLAEACGRSFIDTDELIVEKLEQPITALFQQIGESGFRKVEAEVVREVSRNQGCVIATGGGAVLRAENVDRLRENGRIYFLDRLPALLTATADRPLSPNREELMRRYEERYPIYSAVCDVRVEADGAADAVANLIREDFLNEHFGDKRA